MSATVYSMESASSNTVWVVEGNDVAFAPASLPAPTMFIAINPLGYDNGDSAPDINEVFSEAFADPDAELYVVRGAFGDVQHALFKQAKLDADDHYECDNGGLYALWDLKDGRVLVGGFDNGGSDIAQSAAHDVAHEFAIEGQHSRAHFDASVLDGTKPAEAAMAEHIQHLVALEQRQRLEGTLDALPTRAHHAKM